MRICVVGCGAIGSLYAAHLARLDDLKVWAYDVSADHVAAINRDGLRLTGPRVDDRGGACVRQRCRDPAVRLRDPVVTMTHDAGNAFGRLETVNGVHRWACADA